MNTKKIGLSIDSETGFLREDDARKYFSTFGWFCFAFCICMFAARELIASLVYVFLPQVYDHYLFSNLFSFVLLYGIAFPAAYPILKRLPKVSPLKEKLDAKTVAKGFFVAYITMYAGNLVSVYLIQLLEGVSGNALQNPLEESIDSTPMWANLLFVAILAPVLEEIVFRGILCKRLLALGEGFAIVLSGVFFALLHGNLYQLFYAFTLGCFFAFVYIKTGKIIYSILYHVFINFMGSVVTQLLGKLIRLDDVIGILSSEEAMTALANGDLSIIEAYAFDILVFSIYSVLIYGLLIAGLVIVLTSYKKIKLQSGPLPPPKKSRASIIFLNSGIAAAIAILVILLILPIVLQ